MASLPSGFAGRSACGIYLGLVKENFLHDSSRVVPNNLAIETSKAIFFQTGVGGVVLERTVL